MSFVPKSGGPAELGDRQALTEGRSLYRTAISKKEVPKSDADALKLNNDLSALLRSSVFPGAISPMAKKSVSQEMMEECRPHDAEYKVDKTHFPAKYEEKAFLEAEFGRRLLAKQMAKEAMS